MTWFLSLIVTTITNKDIGSVTINKETHHKTTKRGMRKMVGVQLHLLSSWMQTSLRHGVRRLGEEALERGQVF